MWKRVKAFCLYQDWGLNMQTRVERGGIIKWRLSLSNPPYISILNFAHYFFYPLSLRSVSSSRPKKKETLVQEISRILIPRIRKKFLIHYKRRRTTLRLKTKYLCFYYKIIGLRSRSFQTEGSNFLGFQSESAQIHLFLFKIIITFIFLQIKINKFKNYLN